MPLFYDSSGNPYQLTKEIGRGGEGVVYFCPDSTDIVAKIYHEPIDAEKEEKLRWMAKNGNEHLLKVAAWILDTLHETPDGKIAGFLMPSVKAKEIHELYSLKSRRVYFPEATWEFLIHTAINISRAFYVLHKYDHIMGDVNHGNCVVLADGTVKLIDCDSYSIKTEKMRYRCDVGVATHLASELQGKDLGEIERQKTHDNFGLAVMIFQLLFLGRHPFSGNYLGAEDKSLEDCIREYRFAYGNQEITHVKRPPGTLSLNQVSPPIAHLFKQAFFSQQRPEPHEWIEALDDLKDNLRQCSVHVGHHYYNQLTLCPFCEIEAKSGLMLFPYISSNRLENEGGLNIFTVENLLANIALPQENQSLAPITVAQTVHPSPEAIEHRNFRNSRALIVGLIQFSLVVVFSIAAGGCTGFFVGIATMVIFLLIFHGVDKPIRDAWQRQLVEARQKWANFTEEWNEKNNPEPLQTNTLVIRGKLTEYQRLQHEKRNFIKRQTDEHRRDQLNSFLITFSISDAELPFEQSEDTESKLKQFRIETAADVTPVRLKAIEGSDNEKKLLLDWRLELESKFEFKPETEIAENLKNVSETRYSSKQREIEQSIERLLGVLRSGSLVWQQNQRQMLGKVDQLKQQLLQVESDYRVVKNNPILPLVLGAITFFIPIMIGIFEDRSPSRSVVHEVPYPVSYNSNTAVNKPANYVRTEMPNHDVYVKENISDREIGNMLVSDRLTAARSLNRDAMVLIASKQYDKAERKLRLAMRYTDSDVQIILSFARLLYDTKKYSESIMILQKGLLLDYNENIRIMLGSNYLQLKRYDEAQEVFERVLEINPNSFEAAFNLGLVFRSLGDNYSARKHLAEAVALSPDDAEARYEYALVLSIQGFAEKAKEQHDLLHQLDQKRAEQLRKIIKVKPIGNQRPSDVFRIN